MANNRLIQVFVKVYGVYNARRLTTAASDALILFQCNAAAFSQGQRVGRTRCGACRFTAGMANCFNQFTGDPAICTDFDAAFLNRMAFPVESCANKHAAKTTDAFGHVACSQNFSHTDDLLII